MAVDDAPSTPSDGEHIAIEGQGYGGAGGDDPRGALQQALIETDAASRGVEIATAPAPPASEPRGSLAEVARTARDLVGEARCEADGDWYCYHDGLTAKRYRRPSTDSWACRIRLDSGGLSGAWHVTVSGEVPAPYRAGDFTATGLDYAAAQEYAEALMSWLAEYQFADQRLDHADGQP